MDCRPKRVAIVGAGAAGMAAAWSMSRYPDKFKVTVIEAGAACGGVACTLDHEGKRVNFGVQGGAPASHQNTIALMREFGFSVGDAQLDVSFGKGEHNWKNYESKPLQRRLRKETARFGKVLRWISRFEWLSIFVSIEWVLWICRFSAEFRQRMVYPLVALFFGTGNQTADCSAAIVARVFLDKSLALFEYDPERLVSQSPTNIAFHDLEAFYHKMRASLEGDGVRFLMRTRATALRRDPAGAELYVEDAPVSWRAGSDQSGGTSTTTSRAARTLGFDEVIFACAANVACAILGKGAGWLERRVLRNVEYFRDLTVTHTDDEYMRRHNEVDGRAIYFVRPYEAEPARVEMGFDLTAYQPELRARRDEGGARIYQTIYLDESCSEQWSVGQLDPSKVIDRAWWVCFSHTFRHFRRVVPWVWALQGRRHTWFAGSWTLFNTHDIAICSGLAAAQRLGAPYPFGHLPLAAATFDTVLGTSHLRRR